MYLNEEKNESEDEHEHEKKESSSSSSSSSSSFFTITDLCLSKQKRRKEQYEAMRKQQASKYRQSARRVVVVIRLKGGSLLYSPLENQNQLLPSQLTPGAYLKLGSSSRILEAHKAIRKSRLGNGLPFLLPLSFNSFGGMRGEEESEEDNSEPEESVYIESKQEKEEVEQEVH